MVILTQKMALQQELMLLCPRWIRVSRYHHRAYKGPHIVQRAMNKDPNHAVQICCISESLHVEQVSFSRDAANIRFNLVC